ncbi:hypothetical protein BpHYR1_000020 [Brachionus plicatilis]|uniref:Uncharacterized protein n=1 Tax=Brachionus plicatilis TaxID=10195 RepID=A0A3M7P7W1_BRAPC|nr:hypothetical protein BpHYR1_000020 [Brachionus plicatilis]
MHLTSRLTQRATGTN